MPGKDWQGQNIPSVHYPGTRNQFFILPVLEFLLAYDEDSVGSLLPAQASYGWDDSLLNAAAWANNYYKVTWFIPDFSRFGCLPDWFPTTDRQGRELSPQGQVERFLYLLDLAYGGLPADHQAANPSAVAAAIMELHEDMGEYEGVEEDDGLEWALIQKD